MLYWPIRILDRNSPFCNWKCNPLNSWLLYFIHFCLKWFIAVWSSLTPAVICHEDKHSSFSVQKAFTNHFQLSITQVTRIHTQPLNAQPGPQLFTQIHWPCEKKPPHASITLISGALQWQLWFTNTHTQRWWTGSFLLAYPLRPPVCSLKWLCYNTQGLPGQWCSVHGWSVLFMRVLLL